MRQTEAIDAIAGAAMADGLVEAALLKGSFGRGDEDAFSDVDLYLVVSPEVREAVLARRRTYLAAFDDPVFLGYRSSWQSSTTRPTSTSTWR